MTARNALFGLFSAVEFLLILAQKSAQVSQKPVDGFSKYLIEKAQVLNIKLYRYLFHNLSTYFFILLLALFVQLVTLHFFLLCAGDLFLLLALNVKDLRVNNLIEVDEKLLFKPFGEKSQSITYFYFGDLRRKLYIFVALEENHCNLVLFPLVPGHQI